MNRNHFPPQGGRGGGIPAHYSLLTILCLLLIALSSCADMFQEKIPLPVNNNPGSLGDVFRQVETITQLDAPAQLYAAPFYSRSQILLTWEPVRSAAYYMIERAVAVPVLKDSVLEWETPGDEDYEIIEKSWYDIPSYTDTIINEEIIKKPELDSPEFQNRYYYRISAFNPARGLDESAPCEPQYAMLFRAPSNVRASGGVSTEYIEVRWEGSEDAKSYKIERSSNESDRLVSWTVPNNQNYHRDEINKNDQGVDFFYTITAVNSFGNASLQTKPAMGYAKQEGAPDSPVVRRSPGFGRGNSSTVVKIEWDKVDDAEYYAVYRYSKDGKTGVVDSSLTRLAADTPETYWVDSAGLKPSTYYYYRVQAIGKDPADKELKSPFSVNDEDTESYLLSPPDTVIAEKKSDETITIKWTPPIGSAEEVQSFIYTVYADTEINGSFTHAAKSGITSNIGADGYIQAEGVSAEYGFFRVVTFRDLAESAPSIVVAPAPSAAVIQDATQHAFISSDAAANANGVYPVRITWKKPDNDDPVFYHVQRSQRADGGFSRVNDAPLRADGTGTAGYSLDAATGVYAFIDRNDTAKAGRKYYYRVLSLNQLGGGSFYSANRTGWGGLTHAQYLLEYNKTMGAALKKLTLMYKPGSTDKLGTETKNGTISGTIYYDGKLQGLGAYIEIKLTNYADFYIENVPENGAYFTLSGNSDTSANMSSNGDMKGTVTCTGMYPGTVSYNGIQIKGGAAGGGTYGVQPEGFPLANVPYTVLN